MDKYLNPRFLASPSGSRAKAHLMWLPLWMILLHGCATYQPVPPDYAGPTALLWDTGFIEENPGQGWSPLGHSKGQFFVALAIDGHAVENSLDATGRASYGHGFRLSEKIVNRPVPAVPMKVRIRGTHKVAAPIHEMASRLAGTFFSVEGDVQFTPTPERVYAVRGRLEKEGSSVWIEDDETKLPVTDKVFAK